MLTDQEIRDAIAADPALQAMIDEGNYQGVADSLPAEKRNSIPVEDVFDVLFTTGAWATIKVAAASGNANAGMANVILQDAKELGPGMVRLDAPATIALLDALETDGLLSSADRDALHDRCPDVSVTWQQVKQAVEGV